MALQRRALLCPYVMLLVQTSCRRFLLGKIYPVIRHQSLCDIPKSFIFNLLESAGEKELKRVYAADPESSRSWIGVENSLEITCGNTIDVCNGINVE